MIGFKSAVELFFKNYCVFSGRANRPMYWWPWLFIFVIELAIDIIFMKSSGTMSFLNSVFGLIVLLPSLGVAVRRLHDIGKGGGWIFINFIPLIGQIWFIVLMATPGEPYDNRFGSPVE